LVLAAFLQSVLVKLVAANWRLAFLCGLVPLSQDHAPHSHSHHTQDEDKEDQNSADCSYDVNILVPSTSICVQKRERWEEDGR